MKLATRHPHHRRSALLQLALCALMAVAMLLMLALQDTATERQAGGAAASTALVWSALALPASLLLLFEGWAAWRYLVEPSRSRPAFIASSVLLLPVVPVGTVVGLYSLWVALVLPPPVDVQPNAGTGSPVSP